MQTTNGNGSLRQSLPLVPPCPDALRDVVSKANALAALARKAAALAELVALTPHGDMRQGMSATLNFARGDMASACQACAAAVAAL